ncbi:TRAP transporter small permease [uncultured Martelella sp.]|uniref:TRAP transporter small permease n=1 Tax=uncultured Martelella sp. TaxID=392331 RepID=UPI0029C8C99A|nr:TRAP transporter small permease [uncultured Martelella sp.]
MSMLTRIVSIGWRIIDALIALALVVMIVLVFANVVLRYGFSSGILGSVEISRLLFVWVIMLGAATCLRNFEHLALADIAEAVFPKARFWLRRFVNAVILGCCIMLVLGAGPQVVANWDNISPMSGIPVGMFYLAGVIGGVLMAGIALLRLIDPRNAAPDYGPDAENAGENAQ